MDICSMIKETKLNGGDIWITSDLHMLKRGKDTPRIVSNDEVIKNITKAASTMITENDMLIFLGDLLDDTIPRTIAVCEFSEFTKMIKCKRKVWIRGNNDMLSDKLLKNNGWDVCYSAVGKYNKHVIVFSHTSLEMVGRPCINIHGHMHRNDNNTMYYYHDPIRCINVAPITCKGYFINIDVIDHMIDEKVWTNNVSAWSGEEKPGMSKFIYEQAMDEFNDDVLHVVFGGGEKE